MKPAESIRLWQRVAEVYVRRLRESTAVVDLCLQALGINDALLLEHFRVGYSDGTLSGLLAKEGELREALLANGLLNSSGDETLQGCLVVPIFGANGIINGFCGLKPSGGSEPNLILVPAGAEGLIGGTLTRDGSALFVTDSVLDGFALWLAGFRNVVVLARGLGSGLELEQRIDEYQFRKIYLCPFNSERLNVQNLQQRLKRCRPAVVTLIEWPSSTRSAREYFQTHKAQDFEAMLSKIASPTIAATKDATHSFTENPEGLDACLEGRRYEVRAIQRPGPGRLRANVRALGESGRFVVETVDFYYSRSRRGFVSEAARMFHQSLEVVESDFNRLTDEVERRLRRLGQDGQTKLGLVDENSRAEGAKLGRAPDLVGEIVRDMGSLGMIGEEANKLLGYLAMTSRKQPDPLALLILSGSGSGKSHLQDTILALCPEEDLIRLTSLTGQALFYRGQDSLRHKVLALEESAGAKGADYAIRNLISARKLVIETTVKNPLTGKLETQVNTVHGPTAVFQTTTSPRTDAETRSRFILVSVDESTTQTRAILQRQRQVHTLEGWRQCQTRERILSRHHAFQRLLRQLPVINPFEPLLSYPEENLLVRRDHPKYLQLILAVAFLHQMQRPLRHDAQLGDYLEVTLDDIAIANALAHELFGNSLADLSQPARDLLGLIQNFMRDKAATAANDKDTFSRRELREAISWGDTRLRVHLRELVDLEYLSPLSGRFGVTYHYRLLSRPSHCEGRFLAGLKSVEQLRLDARLAGIDVNLAPASHIEKSEVAAGSTHDPTAVCGGNPQTSQPFSREQEMPSPTGRTDSSAYS